MLVPRSYLFVPGDSPRKMAKAGASAAHALMLDLEDSVAVENLGTARQVVREFLLSHRTPDRQQLWVRINPLDSGKALDDLAAIVAGAPDGVLLPKCYGSKQVARLYHYLTALECRENIKAESIRIMIVATETPAAMFELGSYRSVSRRLEGLTWGAEDLATAMGAVRIDRTTARMSSPISSLAAFACLVRTQQAFGQWTRSRRISATRSRSRRKCGGPGWTAFRPSSPSIPTRSP